MATGGLLHQHLHPRPPLHLAESHYPLCERPTSQRWRFLRKRYSMTPSKRSFLQLRFVQCLKQEEQAGIDGEAVEWVNKAAHDPMVEFDPVTVFRRIVAERCTSASLSMARAKEEEGDLALQTTSAPPFILGSKWRSKSAIALIIALVLLAVAAALYYVRSKKDREDATELASTDAKDTLKEASINGRRKLVEDTIKAPESVITAMALGAASVSRPKVHIDSTHDTLHASNGNVVESQRSEGATDLNPVVSTVAVDDMKSDLYGKPMSGQTPSSSNILEDFTPPKAEKVGVEVSEGPWFGQDVKDTEMPASAESQESQNDSVMAKNGTTAEKLEQTIEESQNDSVVAENGTAAEKLEQTSGEDLNTPLKGNDEATDAVYPEPNIAIKSSAVDLSNGQFDETDSESDDDDNDNTKHQGVEQPFTLNQDDSVLSLESSDSKDGFEDVQVSGGYSWRPRWDLIITDGQENVTGVLSGGDYTSKGIETEPHDLLDAVSSSSDTFQTGQVEEDGGFIRDPRMEPLMDNWAAVQASEEDSREGSKKALEAAVPAITMGVGTVGAIFGVAGGLQVVGFAALASFLSRDFLWAQSREVLWQELNGVTDRQKLLDFLAKRNILRRESENSSL